MMLAYYYFLQIVHIHCPSFKRPILTCAHYPLQNKNIMAQVRKRNMKPDMPIADYRVRFVNVDLYDHILFIRPALPVETIPTQIIPLAILFPLTTPALSNVA